jgi:flotillin
MLEEVTIVALEQSTKEYFRADNVFDAEGLKVITEITSEARRKVHTTEKQTTVSIRNKDLTTQLELLEIERQEAFARAESGQGNRQRASQAAAREADLCARSAPGHRADGNLKTKKRWNSFAPSAMSPSPRRRSVAR